VAWIMDDERLGMHSPIKWLTSTQRIVSLSRRSLTRKRCMPASVLSAPPGACFVITRRPKKLPLAALSRLPSPGKSGVSATIPAAKVATSRRSPEGAKTDLPSGSHQA
jgi:hypothetical protein